MQIEVIYLKNNVYQVRKWAEYEKKEAEVNFFRTIGKLTQERKDALICLRDDEGNMIKNERLNF